MVAFHRDALQALLPYWTGIWRTHPTCAFAAASVVTCGNHKRVLVDVLFDVKMNLPNRIRTQLTDNDSFLGRHGR